MLERDLGKFAPIQVDLSKNSGRFIENCKRFVSLENFKGKSD